MKSFQKEMVSESEYLDKLKLELDKEKALQVEKRRKEMKDAQKVIKENELIKLQKDKQKLVEKEKDNQMLE